MNNGLIHEAKEVLSELKQLNKRMSKQKRSYSKFSGWKLKRGPRKTSSHLYYYGAPKDSDTMKYLGNESNETVLNVKRYRYATEAVSIIDSDISLLESLIDNFISPDYQAINSRLPATYQTNLGSHDSAIASNAVHLPKEAIDWMEHLREEKDKYPPFKPEQLKHPVLDESKVRSKSEVIISNILLAAGIPFVYEVPIFIDGKMLLPDFRILSLIDLKTEIIIEHQGMIFVDEYAQKHIRSVKLYLKSDEWVPNKNLFFTFDDAKETLDVQQVISILRKYVKPTIDDSIINSALWHIS